MITALASVIAVENEQGRNRITLSCDQQTSCSSCASQKSCGTGVVSKAVGNKTHQWQLLTDKPVTVGQTVEIGLSEKNMVQFASLVYLLPIVALMLGAAVGELLVAPALNAGEGAIIFLSLLSMLGGIALARHLSARLQGQSKKAVVLLRVLGESVPIRSVSGG